MRDTELMEVVRTQRRLRGLTQRQLAQRAGVSHSSLEDWERGAYRPRLDLFVACAEALGLELVLVRRQQDFQKRIDVLAPVCIPSGEDTGEHDARLGA